MGEPALLTLLIGLITISVLTMAVTLIVMARQLCTTLQRMQELLPGCQAAVQETRETLGEARDILARTNSATRQVETAIHKTWNAASGLIEHVQEWKEQAQALWGGHHGNGNGKSRHHRSDRG